MRRILAQSRQDNVERTMRMSERRPAADSPALLPDRRREQIATSGSQPVRPAAILADGMRKSRNSISGQTDPMTDGRLAYAVHDATASAESVSDEMLLAAVAKGDKAAMHIMFA